MDETQILPVGRFNAIRRSDLFRHVDEAVLREIEDQFKLVTLEDGEFLFREGDVGDSMYIVGSGEVRVCATAEDGSQIAINEHKAGMCIGEIALLTGQPRTASVYAHGRADVVQLSKSGLAHIANRYPDVVTNLTAAILPRLQMAQLAHVLGHLFGTIEPGALKTLQSEMQWVTLNKGDCLFKQGDVGDGMYILVTGRLQIRFAEDDGSERVLGEVGIGETVGEMALLTGELRSASIYAVRESNVVKLPQHVFERLMEEYPKMMTQITRLLTRRQQRMLKGLHETRSFNYAIIPLTKDFALREFVGELARTMSRFGKVIPMDAGQFDALYGVDGASRLGLDHPLDLAIDRWMCDIDFRYQYGLYVGDPDASAWTIRCLSQADRVIYVAAADDVPDLRPVERMINERFTGIRSELVLVHPAGTEQPKGTAAWLEPRQLVKHHHVRRGDDKHMRRLGRFVTGNAIGLVLSGGGARGYAHVGAVRALTESGVEIDAVGGTSMGAVIAGIYALRQNHTSLFELADRFASTKAVFDYTLPFVALNRSDKLNKVMEAMFGEARIEDLWTPYYCISTNLTRAIPVTHERGLLWKAVRASISIPAVFTPVVRGEDLIVDGGVMNNFPVDVMHDLVEGGLVLGCAVAPSRERSKPFE
ncbi:MAG: cyclic nucleotide-binding domain-containing protein, partial [Anaerolinea sp.]|nr:cyclic nucleotide-binding domain-containing protein [Anaerolinea sp.]